MLRLAGSLSRFTFHVSRASWYHLFTPLALLSSPPMALPDLITIARATQNAALSSLNASNPTYLASLITAASDAIRRACGRDFSLTTYTEYYSGSVSSGTAGPLRLRQFPVVEITRVATSPRPALLVQNTDAVTNQRATVETT